MNDPQWVATANELKYPNPWLGPEKSQATYLKASRILDKHMDLIKKD
jgi:hypothetical protein